MVIGYSQGTTASMYALAEKYSYLNDKVSLFVALGPSVFFTDSDEPMYKKLAKATTLQKVLYSLGYHEFSSKPNGNMNDSRELTHQIKEDYAWICDYDERICDAKVSREKLEQSPSVNLTRADPERIDIYMKDVGGTSLKNLIHMGQLYNSGNF